MNTFKAQNKIYFKLCPDFYNLSWLKKNHLKFLRQASCIHFKKEQFVQPQQNFENMLMEYILCSSNNKCEHENTYSWYKLHFSSTKNDTPVKFLMYILYRFKDNLKRLCHLICFSYSYACVTCTSHLLLDPQFFGIFIVLV